MDILCVSWACVYISLNVRVFPAEKKQLMLRRQNEWEGCWEAGEQRNRMKKAISAEQKDLKYFKLTLQPIQPEYQRAFWLLMLDYALTIPCPFFNFIFCLFLHSCSRNLESWMTHYMTCYLNEGLNEGTA